MGNAQKILTSAKKYTAFFPEAYGRVGAILEEALAADKNFDARLKAFEALVPKKAVAKLNKTAAKQDKIKSLALLYKSNITNFRNNRKFPIENLRKCYIF
ncbi:MAG: hypothetical protein IJM92_09535 [Fibrobacter sp.]|uniref:hypothetical protein n=1 Tax=Fibrobacter sp. TaxID=35828 RepID=UPI0025C6D5FB|nr:hypothetical protein [Fibrobacter sp.]MBQ3715305.1 hypothetical protein [Fibrobacter sp.]MBQ7079880.1 hypothetical protein [Fibrobacter sp.]